jgi:hypothetical protein
VLAPVIQKMLTRLVAGAMRIVKRHPAHVEAISRFACS